MTQGAPAWWPVTRRGWEEVQEGGSMCIPRADSCWCMAETNTVL